MNRWFSNYYNNLIENYIFKMLYKYCGTHLDDLCVLDTTTEEYWVDFYLNTVQATLVTSLDKNPPCVNKFIDVYNYDILDKELYESIGPFIGQYDVIHVLSTLSYELNDFMWQKALENLCTYLKSGGFMIITGDLQSSYTEDSCRHRSSGLWRAIINNSGCTVKHFIKTPTSSILNIPNDILIVGKK